MKPENSILLRYKNTNEITINHKGIAMVEDFELGLQTTNVKRLG